MTVTSQIFRRPAEAAGIGLCNNLWDIPKMKDCGNRRRNPEETKKGTHQQHPTDNTHGTALQHKTTPSQSVAGHRLFSTPNQSESHGKNFRSPSENTRTKGLSKTLKEKQWTMQEAITLTS